MLSWRTNVKAQKRIRSMYWPGWWRHTELAQGHVAGSIFLRLLFSSFFRSKNWASYQALSHQRCIEPATWHWASNEGMVNLYCTGPTDFPMQPLQFQQIKLLINSGTMWDKIEDWQSIHIYVTPTVKLWSIWSNTSFLEGDAYPWAGRRLGKATFDIHIELHDWLCPQWCMRIFLGWSISIFVCRNPPHSWFGYIGCWSNGAPIP